MRPQRRRSACSASLGVNREKRPFANQEVGLTMQSAFGSLVAADDAPTASADWGR
jgi:hypothetical protein